MNKKRTWFIRIVAIVMAALMVLGVGAMIFQTVFAADGMPATGSEPTTKVPFFILAGALVVIVIVALIPRFFKKK